MSAFKKHCLGWIGIFSIFSSEISHAQHAEPKIRVLAKIEYSALDNVDKIAETIAEDASHHALNNYELAEAKADFSSILDKIETSDEMKDFKNQYLEEMANELKGLNQIEFTAGLATVLDFSIGSNQRDLSNYLGGLLKRTSPLTFDTINSLHGSEISPHLNLPTGKIPVMTVLGREVFTNDEYEDLGGGDEISFGSGILGSKVSQLSSDSRWTIGDRINGGILGGAAGIISGAAAGAAIGKQAGEGLPPQGQSALMVSGALIGAGVGLVGGAITGARSPEVFGIDPSGKDVTTSIQPATSSEGKPGMLIITTETDLESGESKPIATHFEPLSSKPTSTTTTTPSSGGSNGGTPNASSNSDGNKQNSSGGPSGTGSTLNPQPDSSGTNCNGCGGSSMPREEEHGAKRILSPIQAQRIQAKIQLTTEAYLDAKILTDGDERKNRLRKSLALVITKFAPKTVSSGFWEEGTAIKKDSASAKFETHIKDRLDSVINPNPINVDREKIREQMREMRK